MRPMTSWLLPRSNWQPLGNNWRKSKGSKTKQRKPAEDAQLQNPPPPSQQEQAKEPETPQGTSSDKVAEVSQVGATSQSFEQALALTTLLIGGASKEKDKEVPFVFVFEGEFY